MPTTSNRLSVEEVNFSRLLRITEKLFIDYKEGRVIGVEGENKGIPSTSLFAKNYSTQPSAVCYLFEQNLQQLRDQWQQLAANDSIENSQRLKRLHGGPPPSQMSLAAYKNKINHLQQIFDSIIEQEKEQTQAGFHSSFSSSSFRFQDSQTTSTSALTSVSHLLSEKEDLFSSMGDSVGDIDSTALSVEDQIKKHREIQEQLTSDILLMVSALKETSTQSLNIVKEDNSRLETVEQEVAENIELITSENKQLKEQKKRSGWISSFLWSLMFLVFVSFFVMYYLIRFSGGRILF